MLTVLLRRRAINPATRRTVAFVQNSLSYAPMQLPGTPRDLLNVSSDLRATLETVKDQSKRLPISLDDFVHWVDQLRREMVSA